MPLDSRIVCMKALRRQEFLKMGLKLKIMKVLCAEQCDTKTCAADIWERILLGRAECEWLVSFKLCDAVRIVNTLNLW